MSNIISLQRSPSNSELRNAHFILKYTINTTTSFLEVFNDTRARRNARGTATHVEQDLLRAMLLFSSSGLDSLVKQIISDSLDKIIRNFDGAFSIFKSFVEKKLVKDGSTNHKYFAELVITNDPKQFLIDELITDLKSNSTQSADQLFRVFSFLDISAPEITNDINKLKSIFIIRNQIAHEMDIDFKQPTRNRIARGKNDMIEDTKFILNLSSHILKVVDNKLSSI